MIYKLREDNVIKGLILLCALGAHATFISAAELCVPGSLYKGVDIRSMVAKAALINPYVMHPRANLVYEGWNIQRFYGDYYYCNYYAGCSGAVNIYDNNFVLHHPGAKVLIIAFNNIDKDSNGPCLACVPIQARKYYAKGAVLDFFNIDSNVVRLSGKFGQLFCLVSQAVISCEQAVFNIINEMGINLMETKIIMTGFFIGASVATLFAASMFQHMRLENNNAGNISVIAFSDFPCCSKEAGFILSNRLGLNADGRCSQIVRVVGKSIGIIYDNQDDCHDKAFGLYYLIKSIKLKLCYREIGFRLIDNKKYFSLFMQREKVKFKWKGFEDRIACPLVFHEHEYADEDSVSAKYSPTVD